MAPTAAVFGALIVVVVLLDNVVVIGTLLLPKAVEGGLTDTKLQAGVLVGIQG